MPKRITCHIVVITGRTHCFHDNIYIMLLWDLRNTLCIMDHLWPLLFLSISIFIYVYIYIYICICIIYIYIYILYILYIDVYIYIYIYINIYIYIYVYIFICINIYLCGITIVHKRKGWNFQRIGQGVRTKFLKEQRGRTNTKILGRGTRFPHLS